MLGYSEATITSRAEKRNLSVEDYKKVLVERHQGRKARRRGARDPKFLGKRCISENGRCECPKED